VNNCGGVTGATCKQMETRVTNNVEIRKKEKRD
jgi:hypothetical protein